MSIPIKDKSTLESLVKKTWMYKGSCYYISDYVEAGDDIIFSTDVKAIKINKIAIQEFAKQCLPAEIELAKKSAVTTEIGGIESGVFSELTAGLMTSFREIQGSKYETFLKGAVQRANTKIGLTKAINDIAKTAIAGKKAMREK